MRAHGEGPDDAPAPPRRRGATRLAVPDDATGGETSGARPVRLARFANATLLVLCFVGCVQVAVLVGVELQRLWHTEREVARLEAEILELERESHDLREIALRGDDAAYREQLARRQGYVHPFETRFVGPPNELDPVVDPAP